MPSIEINEKLYNELKSFAEFIKNPIESVVENFLKKDLEYLKNTPNEIFNYFFDTEQILKMVL